MSDGSPRWPGTDGSPGLDFSAPLSRPRSAGTPSAPRSQSSARAGVVDRDREETHTQPTPSRAAPEPPEDAGAPVPPPMGASDARTQSAESTAARREEDSQTHVLPPVKDAEDDPRSAASAKAFSTQSTSPWQSRLSDAAIEVPVRSADPAAVAVPAMTAAAAGGAAGATAPQRSATQKRKSFSRGARRTRKARLRLARIDPWSVMKTAFLFSIAFGVMLVVIASVLWSVLSGSGALEAMDSFLAVLLGDGENNPFQLENYLNTSRVLGFATLIAAIDVVIITAVATLFAFLYNLAATIIGGLEVTLAED